MKHNIVKSIILFTIALIFIQCEEDDTTIDTTAPEINLLSPADGDTLHLGEELHFECEFIDDVELGSYKIEFHNNFNGHAHKNIQLSSDISDAWSFSKSWNFDSGLKLSTVHHHEIEVPDSIAAGEYHMGVYCVDAAGIESHVYIEVILSNEEESDHDHDHL